MKLIYFEDKAEAEQLQQRLFEVLRQEGRLVQGTVRYSNVYEEEGRHYILVLDEHIGYLTEEERNRLEG